MSRADSAESILAIFLEGAEKEWDAIYSTHGPFTPQFGCVVQDARLRFSRAKCFAGHRDGCAFKTGTQGLGY